jgi:hypothetical protein
LRYPLREQARSYNLWGTEVSQVAMRGIVIGDFFCAGGSA